MESLNQRRKRKNQTNHLTDALIEQLPRIFRIGDALRDERKELLVNL